MSEAGGEAPLQITHITRTVDPAAGGVPAVAMRLAAAAAEAGNRVSLLAEGPLPKLQRAQRDIRGFQQVAVHSCDPCSPRELLRGRLDQALENVVRESDVIHLHGVWDSILVAAARIARSHKVPYVICPHGMLDPWSLQQSRLKKRLAMRTTHRSFLSKAAALHALNQTEADLWRPLRLLPSVAVVPNGIDLRELPGRDPQQSRAVAKRLAVENRRTILFLGRLHYKKGLDLLAAAFQQVAAKRSNVDLLVAGPDEGAESTFQASIAHFGLEHRVHMLGPLYGQEKYDVIRLADAFCLPSRQEGFSIAILESIACGTPVVISQECHFDEVGPAGVGSVCRLDAAEIADALVAVIDDEPLRSHTESFGPQWIGEHFSWSQANWLLQKLYRGGAKQTDHAAAESDAMKSPMAAS